jgi:hypothetical protein
VPAPPWGKAGLLSNQGLGFFSSSMRRKKLFLEIYDPLAIDEQTN